MSSTHTLTDVTSCLAICFIDTLGPIAHASVMKLQLHDITSVNVLEVSFYVNRKGGIGGGRCMHPKGANRITISVLGCININDLVGTGRAIFVIFGVNGVRNKRSHIVRPPFPVFKGRSSAMAGWYL